MATATKVEGDATAMLEALQRAAEASDDLRIALADCIAATMALDPRNE